MAFALHSPWQSRPSVARDGDHPTFFPHFVPDRGTNTPPAQARMERGEQESKHV